MYVWLNRLRRVDAESSLREHSPRVVGVANSGWIRPTHARISILSWHTVLSDPGEFDHRQFQRSDVDAAFAESRPARHSQDSRNPFHAGDDFRGFMVHTSATVCQLARPLHGSDRLPSQRGFYIRAFSGLVTLLAAGYNYNSDWTPLLAGLSPARMAASLAAPTPSSQWTFTTYSLPVSRRTHSRCG